MVFCFVLFCFAEVCNNEGDVHSRKEEYGSAIDCYTKGIKANCKNKTLNAMLFTNRANAHFCLGENFPPIFFNLVQLSFEFFLHIVRKNCLRTILKNFFENFFFF